MDNEKLKDEIRRLRSSFITINAEVTKLFAPKIFILLRENISNLRNLAIIAGAMATFGLLIFNNVLIEKREILLISVLGLLIDICFIFIYLNKTIADGINRFTKAIDEETEFPTKGQEIINNFVDGVIEENIFKKEISPILQQIEKKSRPKTEKRLHNKDYTPDLLTALFVLSVLLMIVALSFNID
jgi:hypothetical protein